MILVAHEILPSQAMSLGDLPIAGIVTETGGGTSHAAILARSRGIPAVSGVDGIIGDVQIGDLMIVDGRDGVVIVRPDQRGDLRLSQGAARVLRPQGPAGRQPRPAGRQRRRHRRSSCWPTSTTWPTPRPPARSAPTGVGLFRTEYLFLTHHDVPDEEEQYEYYRQIIEDSPNQTVTIRTLDLGGDKTVPYLGRRSEANPFMGWRSIRLFFEHPKLFETQIRAILRAGRHGKVSMLFPMITTLEELLLRQQAGRGDAAATCGARACRSARTSRRA